MTTLHGQTLSSAGSNYCIFITYSVLHNVVAILSLHLAVLSFIEIISRVGSQGVATWKIYSYVIDRDAYARGLYNNNRNRFEIDYDLFIASHRLRVFYADGKISGAVSLYVVSVLYIKFARIFVRSRHAKRYNILSILSFWYYSNMFPRCTSKVRYEWTSWVGQFYDDTSKSEIFPVTINWPARGSSPDDTRMVGWVNG